MITAQSLLTELGNAAWSGFNKDDMVWGNEDAATAQTELNKAVRYLINLADFPFKGNEQELKTRIGNTSYGAPDGQIETIYNVETLKELAFLGDGTDLDKTKRGNAEGYYIDYFNPEQPTLKIYPIPERQEQLRIVYNVLKPVLSADGIDTKFGFENADDVINMPSTIDALFKDCLVLRVMITNNKDEQDENYRPTIAEFEQAWKVFISKARPVDQTRRIILFD